MALSDIAIKNYKPKEKQYKVSDRNGMYLLIHPNGSKYWRFKYKILGKEKLLSLGKYPILSLKEARQKRDEAKKQLSQDIDPSLARKINKIQKHTE